jgi:hypothetical protein
MTADEKIKEVMELVDGVVAMSENYGITVGLDAPDTDYKDFADARRLEIEAKLRELIKDDAQ